MDEMPAPAFFWNKMAFGPLIIAEHLGKDLIHIQHAAVHLHELDSLVDVIDNIPVKSAAVFDLLVHEQPFNRQCHLVHHALNFIGLVFTEGMPDPRTAEYSEHIILRIYNC
ncbi:hypothetical protein D3C80_1892130 [compost metagenome]